MSVETAAATKVLVAGVGNVLRGDDGFGPAVAERLQHLPPQVTVVETGIGGVALLQELMGGGYDALIVIDAVDRGEPPGTVFLITPEVLDAVHIADVHLANPDRVLSMAKTIGVLPARLRIVGCQPAEIDELSETLSEPVARAIPLAVSKIEEIVGGWL